MRRFLLLGLWAVAPLLAGDFTVTFLHVNDTHARIEPTMIEGKPYGGMPRLGTLVEQFRKSDPNVLFLHAGDAFQGTFFFNAYEGLADLAFLNFMHPDAMAVGNHEFDKGPRALGEFARNALFPLVSVNLDVDGEPLLKGEIRRSVIVTRGKERIGIVGATTPELPEISNPGPNVHMRDLKTSIQTEVDALEKMGINKIVLVTHVGYLPEIELAKTIRGVDVIIGGHSHTLLGTSTAPGWPASEGPYPTVVDTADGHKALVVQAWQGERVLGRLQVTFDDKGHVKRWSNNQPVIIDEHVAEQPYLKSLVAAFDKPIEEQRDRKIAVAVDTIAQGAPLGEKIADGMLEATANRNVVLAMINSGAVRASLEKGDITFGNAVAVQPFNNTLVIMDVTGAELKQSLEEIVESGLDKTLWVSKGAHYILDLSKSAGMRVSDLTLGGKPVDPRQVYRICVSNFIAAGGDGVATLKRATGFRSDTQMLDIDVFLDYLMKNSPLRANVEGRVVRIPKP